MKANTKAPSSFTVTDAIYQSQTGVQQLQLLRHLLLLRTQLSGDLLKVLDESLRAKPFALVASHVLLKYE
jgi:hypothetical protein